jgi:hypothetical protein
VAVVYRGILGFGRDIGSGKLLIVERSNVVCSATCGGGEGKGVCL